MARANFYGTWEVVECEYFKGSYMGTFDRCGKYMEGIKFRLDEFGDVTWYVGDELKSVPLFSCETYEIYILSSRSSAVLRFGAYGGHVFEFACDNGRPTDLITLSCDGFCVLHCVRSDDSQVNYCTSYFSLLTALEDGNFSDITITASNNKQFKVHSTVLELIDARFNWHADPPPFSNLPEDVLGTILHFLYSECLPENLTEETARRVVAIARQYKSLGKLETDCELYLKNMVLKQQIIGLVNDMHSYINQIIDRFQPEHIVSIPAKLCFIIKQSIRDAAVVGAKLLLLCDLFTKKKNELTRVERHEIIRYAKSRFPVFLSQLTTFLETLKNTFSTMTPPQMAEIATFLVQEIEVILDTTSMLIVHVEKALQQIIQGLFKPDVSKSKSNVGDMLSKTVRNLLHMRELSKLHTIHEQISCSLGLLVLKKESFNDMSSAQKVRSISRTLEQLNEELPIFIIKLENATSTFDERLEWSEFKFCFKVATSKVVAILQKVTVHIDSLQDVLMQVCELVQRDAFTQTLQTLGLLHVPESSSHATEPSKMSRSSSYSQPKYQGHKLNLLEYLCSPPKADESLLARKCPHLLASGKKADMEFEVIGSSLNGEQSEEAAQSEERCIIKSHRVIVASRCDWFRRALSSGMREAIDKKIVIHDTSPFLFRIFLEYLYSGRLKQETLTTEQLVELLLLSDRYEMDSLKVTCENVLMSSIDTDTVFYFLSMADQYNATTLKTRCLNFISQHNELTENEEFFELPISLQAEIFDSVWTQPSGMLADLYDSEHQAATSSTSSNSCYCPSPGPNDLRTTADETLLTSDLDPNHSGSTSTEDLHLEEHASEMGPCITKLRDILGNDVPGQILINVILAANFDIGRAVNFYYANTDSE